MNVVQTHASILREREDPMDGYEPIPLWMVTLFMLIVFWAGMYLSFYSGGFQPDVYNATQVSWVGGSGEPAGPPDPLVVGKRLYTANCVACHQTTGQGVAGQFPTLVGSEWVLSTGGWQGDNHLVKILLHGLQGPILVKGEPYNNAMPPWKQLSDEQISSILTYIRQEWGNAAPPITPEFVASLRTETDARGEPWTQAELQAIPATFISDAAPAAAPVEGEVPAEGDAPAEGGEDAAPAAGAEVPASAMQLSPYAAEVAATLAAIKP